MNYNDIGSQQMNENIIITKRNPSDKVVAFAGNPNVGKSTVFNALTGLNQHTGNWPGKTVTTAQGYTQFNGVEYLLVDLPGTYSIMAHSAEEEVARDFICFGGSDCVVVVCDATCLERNLNLALQVLEITDDVVLCVNLIDEAQKKNISIDFDKLSSELGIPIVKTSARDGIGIEKLMEEVQNISSHNTPTFKPKYTECIETAVSKIEPAIKKVIQNKLSSRWVSLKLLSEDIKLIDSINHSLNIDITSVVSKELSDAKKYLSDNSIDTPKLRDNIVSCIVLAAECVAAQTVSFHKADYNATDRKLDKILTSKVTGFPIMLLMLLGVFWLTITGANYPSSLLSDFFFYIQDRLIDLAIAIGIPTVIYEMLILGVYRVLAWVVSVMLPPMAIFFPLFTLLEDLGYLPRVAFNLDKYFKKCSACGKQALTMCMGFGCNAAGIVGCRIIDSPRERLIAIITNNFVPCNGRFPTIIAILSMFFVTTSVFSSLYAALLLTLVILFGIMMTLIISKILSMTILKGVPSSFTLELPPYRKPQIGKVIVRSIFDRTLFVLGRAIAVAAPAGLIIWVMANVTVGDVTILKMCSDFLDPFAKAIGMDGVILIAFILGFPANEIVVPIMIMAYMSTGSILDIGDSLHGLLLDNGWTWITAVNVMLFSVMHWPCSTTCLTIKKETGSLKWTAISMLVPTVCGVCICYLFTTIARFIV